MDRWYAGVTAFTESVLTWRKRRIQKKKAKQKKRHVIIEWLDAFLWAAFVVLLINQYLFQAYQIPSPSMEDTLKVSDRIFVNKLIFGPELLPGIGKLPGYAEPKRSSIIIFESPTYISKGPVFDIVQRILYMLTLSLVDIDRDESGQPRAHFLIKRAIGVENDRLRIIEGEVELKPPGFSDWVAETALDPLHPVAYTTKRTIQPGAYEAIEAEVRIREYADRGIAPLEVDEQAVRQTGRIGYDLHARGKTANMVMHTIVPHDPRYRSEYTRYTLGWLIPKGWIFPMGDNRDNSNDARYFGPVALRRVLGRASFIYWPLSRLGPVR